MLIFMCIPPTENSMMLLSKIPLTLDHFSDSSFSNSFPPQLGHFRGLQRESFSKPHDLHFHFATAINLHSQIF